MRKIAIKTLVALGAIIGFATSASAATYVYTISGSGFSATGTITDDNSAHANPYPCVTCVSTPGSLVTAITGTINGQAITGVAPLDASDGNDNLLYSTAPFLDWGDVGFTTATTSYNVFNGNYAGLPGDFLAVSGGSVYANPVAFSLTVAVPEAAT